MKKLPYCTLLVGAIFVTFGIRELFRLKAHIEPFGLLFPLLWDLTMVVIGLGIIFRCNCARKAGLAWCIFCIVASLTVGVAALFWIMQPRHEPFSLDRMFFITLAVVFGVVFGAWQLKVLRSTSVEEWTNAGPASRDGSKSGKPHLK
ncbi:MAG: hypothetical protein EXS39_03880 [Opitutaceae bacterium]|nr:hypothetical protein [Opitutaceae bacterium]